MNADHASLSHHPAPLRHRVGTSAAIYGVIGGPLAWFLQLCAGYALASWPCFPNDRRLVLPAAGFGWTWPAMILVLIAGIAIAFGAFCVSWRTFRRTREESAGDHRELMVGSGRTRFLALWGMLLGAGFAIATAVTAVAFVVLPRCDG